MKRFHYPQSFTLIICLISLICCKYFVCGWYLICNRATTVVQGSSVTGVVKNITKYTGKHLCQSLFFSKVALLKDFQEPATLFKKRHCDACNYNEKATLAQVFSCEFSEMFEDNFFYRTPLVAASNRPDELEGAFALVLTKLSCDLEFYIKSIKYVFCLELFG